MCTMISTFWGIRTRLEFKVPSRLHLERNNGFLTCSTPLNVVYHCELIVVRHYIRCSKEPKSFCAPQLLRPQLFRLQFHIFFFQRPLKLHQLCSSSGCVCNYWISWFYLEEMGHDNLWMFICLWRSYRKSPKVRIA